MGCGRRHALVTGASSGMGRAIALALTARGQHVFAGVRRPADAEALARLGLTDRPGSPGQPSPSDQPGSPGLLTPLLLDITHAEQLGQACATIAEHVGPDGLDALVNNAGVGLAWPLELVPLDALRAHFEVNVHAQVAVTQACLPLLRQARGRIIMIGSIADRITPPFVGPLAASKHALLALTEALRQELAPWNIRVVLIEPATIHTEAGGKFEHDAAVALEQFTPAGRALYAAAYRSMATRFGARHRRGSDPAVVAAVVVQAIETPRPRARYLVGQDARRFAVLALLPAWVLDPLRRRIFRLPGPGQQ